MDRGRFSLLLLDPGEIYFEDFSAILIPSDATRKTFDQKKQEGRLKMCSKSLVFDPKDINKPLIKIPLKDCRIIERWKGSAPFVDGDNVLSVSSNEHVEMLEGNMVAPYKFRGPGSFLFLLNYANVVNCLPQICQLHRASSLPAAEQADMIAAIVHSRQARVNFDALWLDLYEKVILEMQADKVTPLAINPGRILLSTAKLYFQPYNNIEAYPVLKISLSSIKSIVKRRFLLRHIGLEIFCDSTSSIPHIFIALRSAKERDQLYHGLLEQPELKLDKIDQNVMTLQWQNGIISNYDYLLYVNSLGDRTTNDLTQYPVFPWIISDYTSNTLDLNDPKVYRDLSKPVGALNEVRLQRLIERYEEMSLPKFLYGSHYSTPGFVLFYLVRLYPHYMLCLQGGRFDHPDRMFNSCADVFRNCLNNMSDFKELIPEFYDVKQEGKFLVNHMGINFGYKHDGVKVGDVLLPPWADSPKHFVQTLRDALESDIVSQNLHSWIDLIFGYKQQGEEAIKAKNLFYYLCYEGNVDLDSIADLNERHALEVQIMEFGQIPKQVFKVPHPRRKLGMQLLMEPDQIVPEKEPNEGSWMTVSSLKLYTSFGTHKDTVSCLFITEDNNRVISVGHDSKLKIFSLQQNRQIRSANIGSMPLSSCIQLPKSNVLVIGSWDNQIVLYDLDYGKITDNMLAHEDAVTCMVWDKKSNVLVSGSSDCTAKVWKGLSEEKLTILPCLRRELDHNSHVTCMSFNSDDTHLAVGTDDGEIYIWEMEKFTIKKKFSSHTAAITGLSYGPDGQTLASCGMDKLFQIVDVNTGLSVFSKVLSSPLTCLRWSQSIIILGFNDGTMSLWNILEVKLLLETKAHEGPIRCIDLSADKSCIATGGSDHYIKIWQQC